MDAVSAGASVIAFVGIALRAAVAANGIISLVKDGPQILSQLVVDVDNLRGVLERLACTLLVSTHTSPSDIAALTDLSRRCSADLTSISQKLTGLTVLPSDRGTGRLWKKIQTAFNENELSRTRSMIQTHILNLGLWLTLHNAEKLATAATVSETQSNSIIDLLKQLQLQVTDVQSRVDKAFPENEVTEKSHLPADPTLPECVDRLCQLVSLRECTIASEDARQIIDDLQALLVSARSRVDEAPVPLATASPAPEPDVEEVERGWPRHLELVRSLFFSAPCIFINGESMSAPFPPSPHSDALIKSPMFSAKVSSASSCIRKDHLPEPEEEGHRP